MSEHERPTGIFSDLHVEDGVVRATLLHDPTVEGLDMAIYMDGSASMSDEYENKAKTRSFWEWITSKPPEILPNMVEPQVHWMLEYLATKDRNGLLRVAYWACGEGGGQIEVIGELSGIDAKKHKFPGPIKMGRRTMLVPALKDYVQYMRSQVQEGAKQGCAVIITDGELHDASEVKAYSKQLAADIVAGRLPKMNFVLVGVGKGVNEEQLEEICHTEYPGLGHMWCHRIAEEITEVAQLVAVLVDENMTVAAGGTVYDDRGQVVKVYEARLPAVLEFSVYEGCKSFTLEVSGQKHTQVIPEEEHHDDDDDD
ncbi:MAG: VWA domain-containing protein [Candidatus Eremiobacteraeota bacterium]|nr:VWA domain-containing protein [Candidatus Eremiobacteraeota bacterium]MCW5866235.1 VWA domain-containing protein [Candidatus Eremiobacteraeota bacterium]